MLPMALQVGGAIASGIGGALSDKAKAKAAKQRLKQMQKAMQMYQVGSTDAFGNTLSADKNGRWGYNLTRGSQAAVNSANRANIEAENYRNKSDLDLMRNNFIGMNQATKQAANAGQAAALRRGLQTGSNIGYISNAYNNNNMKNMSNQLLSAYRNSNSTQYNANNRNALINNQINAQIPVNNIQGNLQNMVNSLNKTQMEQQNQIADAAYDKTLSGRMTAANMFTGVGGAMSGIGQNMQQQGNYNSLIDAIKKNPQLIKFLG